MDATILRCRRHRSELRGRNRTRYLLTEVQSSPSLVSCRAGPVVFSDAVSEFLQKLVDGSLSSGYVLPSESASKAPKDRYKLAVGEEAYVKVLHQIFGGKLCLVNATECEV